MCSNAGKAASRKERNKAFNANNGMPRANDPVLNLAISNGDIRDTINKELQKDHINGGERSIRGYVYGGMERSEELYREYRGTGDLVYSSKTGEWTKKERIECNEIVGELDGTKTNKLMIVYSSTGSHLYTRL